MSNTGSKNPFEGFDTAYFKDALETKLYRHFGLRRGEYTRSQLFNACALVILDAAAEKSLANSAKARARDSKQVHYLSMEFLFGRSLMKNAFNLEALKPLEEAIRELGADPSDLFEYEPDAALGNGGLGRLAACYIEAMTTLGIRARGYSICYAHGLFEQKIINGGQVELPDNWLDVGSSWLTPEMDATERVRFGGRIEEIWEEGRMRIKHTDYTEVLAVPMDLTIIGYRAPEQNLLRLWDARSPVAFDMNLFSQGEYLKALEQHAMAEVITKVLYPADNHPEGRSLRLRQQYFFVSATMQNIVRRHKGIYKTLKNFHLKNVIQINDTHPALVIPEFMRILMDDEGFSWDEAWHIVSHSVAYTNHTVLSEALERWNQDLIMLLLPRIWSIICEINDNLLNSLKNRFPDDYNYDRLRDMAIIWDGEVRMANLCVYACFAVNGVSALHTEILKSSIFKNMAGIYPDRFLSMTNGIDHRRWLAQINPELHDLISDLIGDEYLKKADLLNGLMRCADDDSVLLALAKIKQNNKARFAAYAEKEYGVKIDPSSIFDTQVKRLHEYKRQLMNVLYIISLYNRIKSGQGYDMPPRTFFFGAKAAPSYYAAKRIIKLINAVSALVNSDPEVSRYINVIFLENYRVSLAEKIIPASEISEQISLAGKEASGTGNMKFMMNGAITVGTMDGANVEIFELVKKENIFIFGLSSDEAARLSASGNYSPYNKYSSIPDLKAALDLMSAGIGGESFHDIVSSLIVGGDGGQADAYLLLEDFTGYRDIQRRAAEAYEDKLAWNRSSLINIARSGYFAADRSIADYAGKIWKIPIRN